jgi:hypothetical protein
MKTFFANIRLTSEDSRAKIGIYPYKIDVFCKSKQVFYQHKEGSDPAIVYQQKSEGALNRYIIS